MTPEMTDALVQIIKQAIDQKFEAFKQEFERDQKRSLILVAKSAVKTDAELWAKAMTEKLDKAIAELPKPENGKDGQDATIEQVQEAVSKFLEMNPPEVKQEHIADHVAKFLDTNPPQPGKDGKDGKDGERGLDALQIEILSKLDTEKRYPRGTYARYKGGIVRAMRDTDPGEPMQSGWEIMVNGLDDVQIHQLQGGEFAIKTILTSGQSNIVKAYIPAMEYKGVWKESHGEYAKGHTVTQNGSLWHANKPTTDKPGTSDAWTLCVKRGVDGKDLNVVKTQPPASYKL
jgi:vacuolar-type H+-ATPase subunit F/Vma7